ncbi:cupin domain-containing protein [Pseudonocardia sp.]|uniref:cupin domain-containing protein n=1 Tax=Pseudonocardia sp. TaxID=60912 RepID=UPI003D115E1C
MTDPERLAVLLGLEPLPREGGRFRRTFADAHSSAIHYLLVAPEFSALHRLTSAELYHWHAGSPLLLLLLHPDPAPSVHPGRSEHDGVHARATGGRLEEVVLGPDVEAGQRPQVAVPAGTWQGSSPDGAWTLVSTTVAPPFDWAMFTLGDRATLTAAYPAAEARISELTRT